MIYHDEFGIMNYDIGCVLCERREPQSDVKKSSDATVNASKPKLGTLTPSPTSSKPLHLSIDTQHNATQKQNPFFLSFKHLREQCLLFSLFFVCFSTKGEISGMVCP